MAGKYKDYTLGRGELEIALSTVKGAPPPANSAYRYIGNTPELSMTQSSTKLDHYDSDHGLKIKDDSVVLQFDRSGKITADSMDVENLALFFIANKQAVAQTALTGTSEVYPNPKKGYRLQLGTSVVTTGLRNVSNVVVKLTAAPATTYTAGTDYNVDPASGMLTIIAGGAIADDVSITVTFDSAASSRIQVVTIQDALLEGAMRFRGKNPKGTVYDYFWPYVQLTPDGDFAMKGDTWQQMGFNFDILTPGDGRASMYIDGQAVMA